MNQFSPIKGVNAAKKLAAAALEARGLSIGSRVMQSDFYGNERFGEVVQLAENTNVLCVEVIFDGAGERSVCSICTLRGEE